MLGMMSVFVRGSACAIHGLRKTDLLEDRIPVPRGYVRVAVASGGLGEWLRVLPLRPGRPEVMLRDGTPKHNQTAHHAVLDMDVGDSDLQQCADAVIRLPAEYLLRTGLHDGIHFNFTSGDTARYSDWRAGLRPVVRGNSVSWIESTSADSSYRCFREYLDTVFMYAGTLSARSSAPGLRSIRAARW
jgi:hypothetical protein